MKKSSGLVALVVMSVLVTFHPGFFCSAEKVRCESWVFKALNH